MKKLIIFCLLVFSSGMVVAQSDFQNAYILKTETDTVYGEINNKNYYLNSLYCDFRKNKKDTIIRYYPKDLFAYRFLNGKYYISKNIREELKDTSYFFEYLIKGELDIYYIQKKLENLYYVSVDGINLNKLKYSKNLIWKGNRKMLQENKQFIGLLEYYMIDYPELKKDIRRIDAPNHKNLIKLSEKYHNLVCVGGKCIIYEKKISRKIKLDAFVSYNKVLNERIVFDVPNFTSYSSNLLFQLSQSNEKIYFGLGFIRDNSSSEDIGSVGIPLSFNYIHTKKGFSPLLSYSFVFPFFVHTFSTGAQYKIGRTAFFLKGGLNTVSFIFPYAANIGFGLMFDLR